MTQPVQSIEEPDQALVHQFIRLFGRRPDVEELARHRQARARVMLRYPLRLRKSAARLVLRL